MYILFSKRILTTQNCLYREIMHTSINIFDMCIFFLNESEHNIFIYVPLITNIFNFIQS